VKDFVHMKNMAIRAVAINQDGIKEKQEKISKVRSQKLIHETLEGGWSIAKEKMHDQEFIMSLMSSESSLQNICLLHLDLLITRVEVYFGE
jgi:hypothetical protein